MTSKQILFGLLGVSVLLVLIFSMQFSNNNSNNNNSNNINTGTNSDTSGEPRKSLEKELSDAKKRVEVLEEILVSQRGRQADRIKEKACWWREQRKKALSGEISVGPHCGTWTNHQCFWDLYQPTVECDRTRVGYIGDGGKWVCDFEDIASIPGGCVMFSFGVRDSVDFEYQFQKKGCRTYSYDPTPGVRPLIEKDLKERMHFEEVGLGPVSGYPGPNPSYYLNGWPIKNFKDIVASTGEKRIDIVKIDIESSEWSAVAHMLQDPDFHKLQVKQLMIEFHLTVDMNICIKFFDIMEEAGYQIVNKEANTPCGAVCYEYVFVYVGKINCD